LQYNWLPKIKKRATAGKSGNDGLRHIWLRTEYEHLSIFKKLGAIVCKGTAWNRGKGILNPALPKRITACSIQSGLQGIGVDALIKEKTPVWAGWKVAGNR